MPTDKRISELPVASAIDGSDLSILVSSGTNYQFAFSTLLGFIGSNLDLGANISFGGTLPQNTSGKNGDLFINTSAGSFAQKVSDVWTVVYTLPSSSGSTDGTVLYGLGVPSSATGNNNDTYINTGTGVFYKKLGGDWSQVFSMQTGPAGPAGTSGADGMNGADGKTILNGATDPSNLSTGANGDFYINTNTMTFFGPKAGGVWPAGISIVGATGADGPAGPQGSTGATGAAGATGPGVAAGGTTGQVLKKNSSTDYDTSWENSAGDLSSVEGEIGDVWDLRTSSRSTVEAINEILASLTSLPTIRGLVEDFDPARVDLVTISSGNITQIVGALAGTISAQSDSLHQPTYFNSGGPGNKPFFSFSNGYLTGDLILTGTEFTIYVLRKVHSISSVTGVFYNGGASDGYGFADGNTDGSYTLPGGYYQGATALAAHGIREYLDKWEVFAISHSTNVNKFYNAVGLPSFNYNPSTTNPNAPTGQHYIGYIPAQSYYTGGIGRILICNVQHSDSEVNSVMDYFSKHYTIARPLVVHQIGDSISAGQGISKPYPDQELDQMQTDGYYVTFNNQAVSGRTSADCLTGFPTEIVAKLAPSVKNIVQMMVGHNDLAASTDPSTIYTNISNMIADAHAAGSNIKVVLMTPLISSNETGDSVKMAAWTSLRSSMLTNTAEADLVIDMQNLTSMTDPSDMTRYQDGVHPTLLGASEIAAFITPKVEAFFNSF